MTDNPFNRVPLSEGVWAVILLSGPHPDEHSGIDPEPCLGTRSGFASREDAERYARTVSPSWRPMVAKLEAP